MATLDAIRAHWPECPDSDRGTCLAWGRSDGSTVRLSEDGSPPKPYYVYRTAVSQMSPGKGNEVYAGDGRHFGKARSLASYLRGLLEEGKE